MLGRGLISNPELALNYSNQIDNQTIDLERFKMFHDELLNQYIEILSGEKPVLHRMKEFWFFWQSNYTDCDKAIKKIRKANKIQEYKDYVALLLNNY